MIISPFPPTYHQPSIPTKKHNNGKTFWWSNQPIWQILVEMGSSSPSFGVKIYKTYLRNHQVVNHLTLIPINRNEQFLSPRFLSGENLWGFRHQVVHLVCMFALAILLSSMWSSGVWVRLFLCIHRVSMIQVFCDWEGLISIFHHQLFSLDFPCQSLQTNAKENTKWLTWLKLPQESQLLRSHVFFFFCIFHDMFGNQQDFNLVEWNPLSPTSHCQVFLNKLVRKLYTPENSHIEPLYPPPFLCSSP